MPGRDTPPPSIPIESILPPEPPTQGADSEEFVEDLESLKYLLDQDKEADSAAAQEPQEPQVRAPLLGRSESTNATNQPDASQTSSDRESLFAQQSEQRQLQRRELAEKRMRLQQARELERIERRAEAELQAKKESDNTPPSGSTTAQDDPRAIIAGLNRAIPTLDDVESGLDQTMMNALLNDAWQKETEGLLDDARSAIVENNTQWLPEDTDQLTEALKVRIDESVKSWLHTVLQANIGSLHQLLSDNIAQELHKQVQARLDHKEPGHRPPQEDA